MWEMPELSERVDQDFTRTEMVKTIGLAALCVAVLLAVYYTVPITPDPGEQVWLRLAIVVVVFGVVLVHEVHAIARHRRPTHARHGSRSRYHPAVRRDVLQPLRDHVAIES